MRILAVALTCLVLFGCSTAEEPLSDDRIKLLLDVDTQHYQVTGSTTEAIFASIERANIKDGDGTRAVGLTSSRLTYEWEPVDRRGGMCAIDSMTLTFNLLMTLPQHSQLSVLPPTLHTRWTAFSQGVVDHEQRHVDIYTAGGERVRDAMLAIEDQSSCDQLGREIDRVWDEHLRLMENEQDAFHVEDDARLESIRAPLVTRIDAEVAQVESLSREIEALDRRIAMNEATTRPVESQINILKREIQGIEASYPRGAPPNVLSRYNALITQHNGLVNQYNQLIDSVRADIARRNSLVSQQDSLINSIEDLAEEVQWIP